MTQEIIIEMQSRYPFGQLQNYHNQTKVYVRKIIKYNKDNYKKLKQKFQIAKKLSNINIINLLKVLQEQGKFHLLYEYIPLKLNEVKLKQSKEFLQNLKEKLLFLTSFIYFNKISTKFEPDDIGFDSKLQLKYYLDIDFQMIQNDQQNVKNRYFNQVKKITAANSSIYKNHPNKKYLNSLNQKYLQNKISIPSDKRFILKNLEESSIKNFKRSNLNLTKSYDQPSNPPLITSSSIQKYKKTNGKFLEQRQKSIISCQSRTNINNNTLQILNSLEMKIDFLRNNMKKKIKVVIPNDNQQINNSNLKNNKQQQILPINSSRIISQYNQIIQDRQFGQSVRQKWKKSKVDQRKYSGDVNYLSPFLKKTQQYSKFTEGAKSVRTHKQSINFTLQKINQTSQQQNCRKQSEEIRILDSEIPIITINNKQHKYSGKQFIKKQKGDIEKAQQLAQYGKSTIVNTQTKIDNFQKNKSEIKQPLNKNDFEQIKKEQFQNYFNSKEKYVHQFLGLLDDSKTNKINGTTSSTTINGFQELTYQTTNQQLNVSRTCPNLEDIQRDQREDLALTPKSLTSLSKNSLKIQAKAKQFSDQKSNSISTKNNSRDNQQQKNRNASQLKDRIWKAIQKSDRALQKYRKLSTNSLNTQFGKPK